MDAGSEEPPQKFFTKSHKVLRNVRDAMVDVFVALARAVFFWMPGGDEAKGKALMTCHPLLILIIVGMFFWVHGPMRLFIVVLALITVASQWLLGGCVVTRAEQRLTGSKDTILDPFLTLADVSVNRDTRIAATIASSTAICTILVWSLICNGF
jgi:hypothetical protein